MSTERLEQESEMRYARAVAYIVTMAALLVVAPVVIVVQKVLNRDR